MNMHFLEGLPNLESEAPEAPLDRDDKPTKERRFGRLSIGEIRMRGVRAPNYIIDDWLVAGEISFIGGEPQSGKTFLASHAALCIATGKEFFGRKVAPGLVIYQAGESGTGFMDQRIPAWLQYFGGELADNPPFEILPHKIDLFNPDGNDTDALVEVINNIAAEYPGVPLRAFFIDTFAKAMRGADEISGRDVGRGLANMERLARETGAHICAVHHTPKLGVTLRGHTSLKGDVDCVAFVTCDPQTKVRTLKFEKVKDGPSGSQISFELARQVLGERGDGKEISSCVCLPLGEKEAAKRAWVAKGFQLMAQKNEPAVFAAFWKAFKEKGVMATAEMEQAKVPSGTIAVHYRDWRDAYIAGLPDDGSVATTEAAVSKVWARNSQGLRKFGVLGYERPWIWWTGKPIRDYPDTFPKEDKTATIEGQVPTAADEVVNFDF